MESFRKRLKGLLLERGISQKQLAEKAKTTEATISRYLTGKNTPNIEILGDIATALDVSSDYLLGLSPLKNDPLRLSSEEKVVISSLRNADLRDKKIIAAVLEKYMPDDYLNIQKGKE